MSDEKQPRNPPRKPQQTAWRVIERIALVTFALAAAVLLYLSRGTMCILIQHELRCVSRWLAAQPLHARRLGSEDIPLVCSSHEQTMPEPYDHSGCRGATCTFSAYQHLGTLVEFCRSGIAAFLDDVVE